MSPKIVVVGSANTDMVVRASRLPGPGETVLGGRFFTAQGGKGANQAVAAARLGAQVTFVARLGQDALGEAALSAYQNEGIDTRFVFRDREEASGVALIVVNQVGENIITVAPGANSRLSARDVEAAGEAIREADCLLVQLEIPLETVSAAVEAARRYQVRTILNPAPATQLPASLLRNVDVLTPNQHEAGLLAGMDSNDALENGRAIQQKLGVKDVVVTLGAQGALVVAEEPVHVAGFKIRPVDTTAAGDAFNGGLAVALGKGMELIAAVKFACAVGALSATRPGAQPSLPYLKEVIQFLDGRRVRP
jgi:ribokinase